MSQVARVQVRILVAGFALVAVFSAMIVWFARDTEARHVSGPPVWVNPGSATINEPAVGSSVLVSIPSSALQKYTEIRLRVALPQGTWTPPTNHNPSGPTDIYVVAPPGALIEAEAAKGTDTAIAELGFVPVSSVDSAPPGFDPTKISHDWTATTGGFGDVTITVDVKGLYDQATTMTATALYAQQAPFVLVGGNGKTNTAPGQADAERTGVAGLVPVGDGSSFVTAHNREFLHTLRAFTLAAPLNPVPVTLGYRSQLDYDGPLGLGFDWSLDERIDYDKNSGRFTWYPGNGHRIGEFVPYETVAGMTHYSTSGVFTRMEYDSQANEVTLRDRFGNRRVFFFKSGRLVGIGFSEWRCMARSSGRNIRARSERAMIA